MNYDGCQWCQGKNGKQYWIASKKIIPPLLDDNGANYEVKYREFNQGELPKDFLWEHSSWEFLSWYKATHSGDAILQGKKELRQQGIIP